MTLQNRLKRNIQYCILMVALILTFVLMFVTKPKQSELFGCEVISPSDFSFLQEGKDPVGQWELSSSIQYNKQYIPFAEYENTFWLSLDLNSLEKQGKLSSPSGKLYIIADNYTDVQRLQEAISDNHAYTLAWLDDEGYSCFYLKCTGLPIAVLEDVSEPEGDEDERYANLSVCSSELGIYHTDLVQQSCFCHRRGNTNRYSEKESLKLALLNLDGKSYKNQLLSLRKDDDWILNSLWDDPSEYNNMLCYSIWDELCDLNHEKAGRLSLSYIELIKNGEYCGLYALEECPYAKMFCLKEKDALIRIESYESLSLNEQVHNELLQLQKNCEPAYAAFEIKYPQDCDKIEQYALWEQVWQWLNVRKNGKQDGSGMISVDLDNLIDYSLFVNLVCGVDNVYKNVCLASYESDGKYVLRKYPWDMNMTFGYTWLEDENEYKRHVRFDNALCTEEVFDEDIVHFVQNDASVATKMADRWFMLRGLVWSDERIIGHLHGQEELLEASGAKWRDDDLWKSASYGVSDAELEKFILARLRYLDGYYSNILQAAR